MVVRRLVSYETISTPATGSRAKAREYRRAFAPCNRSARRTNDGIVIAGPGLSESDQRLFARNAASVCELAAVQHFVQGDEEEHFADGREVWIMR